MEGFPKFDILKAIYQFYDDYVSQFDFVCQPKCAACCTQHVCITTLEGAFIITHLKEKQCLDILDRLNKVNSDRPFSPRLSTNMLAAYCLNRREPPQQEEYFSTAPCPFLENGLCLIYPVRPFACRSFFSQERCDVKGEAVVPPVLVTINILLNQLLEHIDTPGCYGNMIKVLKFLEENLGRYFFQQSLTPEDLAPNRPIPGFLFPPEHQMEVRKVIDKLSLLRIGRIDMKSVLTQILRPGGRHV